MFSQIARTRLNLLLLGFVAIVLLMVHLRDEKVARVVEKVPDLEVVGESSGELLAVGWGGSSGYRFIAVRELQNEGYKISDVTFNYINLCPGMYGRFSAGSKR